VLSFSVCVEYWGESPLGAPYPHFLVLPRSSILIYSYAKLPAKLSREQFKYAKQMVRRERRVNGKLIPQNHYFISCCGNSAPFLFTLKRRKNIFFFTLMKTLIQTQSSSFHITQPHNSLRCLWFVKGTSSSSADE